MEFQEIKVGMILKIKDSKNNSFGNVKILKHPLPAHYKRTHQILRDFAIVENFGQFTSPFIIEIKKLIDQNE
jgi:hypothetical protein